MSFQLRIYKVVRMIPRGNVATYGQVALIAGYPRAARACGSALRQEVGSDLPWHRVINAQGRVSPRGDVVRPQLQRSLLEEEGVRFSRAGVCKLKLYQWEGPEEPLVWEEEEEEEEESFFRFPG